MIRPPIAAALAASLAAPALAAGALEIATTMTPDRPAAAARSDAPPRLLPGDTLLIAVAYRNTGAAALGDVVVASPVPRGLRYRGAAAGTRPPDLSVDGVRFAPFAAALAVPLAAGGSRPATDADVTAVRWRIATLPPGAAGRLVFRAALD